VRSIISVAWNMTLHETQQFLSGQGPTNIAVYRGTYSFLSVFKVFTSFFAEVIFKTKLKKIALVVDEIIINYVGRRRLMKVISFPSYAVGCPYLMKIIILHPTFI
jgi:hypothetical protein